MQKCSNEKPRNAVEGEIILVGGKTKKKVLEGRNKNFMKKPFHLQFMRKMDEVRSQEVGTG